MLDQNQTHFSRKTSLKPKTRAHGGKTLKSKNQFFQIFIFYSQALLCPGKFEEKVTEIAERFQKALKSW